MADYEAVEDIDDVNFDSNDEENEENEDVRVPRRYIQDAINPFDFYDAEEFRIRYRFSKQSVLHGILPEIQEGLIKPNQRGLPINPVMQLLTCLRYYATGSFQLVVGDTVSLSQPTVSRIILRVGSLLASLISNYIKMPSKQESRSENNHLFNLLGHGDGAIGLLGVDGAIDCTHIRLTGTKFQNIAEKREQ